MIEEQWKSLWKSRWAGLPKSYPPYLTCLLALFGIPINY
jgi:hypothetical protein